ncbi:GSCFA domain-containing protein [Flavobacterium cerinum]|uniref:GSCFA domain-containing protein n=1 Tax=Flavobacterium cerinum TaxID=2502784 RepID=A0ABY5ITM1_9FLAO|nr:GSCFA domain-containing protein [Flavobacterium cerinum]UUC45686.1 GSCFA domain-containing protein [Flavobacterium cerinum]
MQFRTQIPVFKSTNPIDYTSQIVSLGSCFAVNMSEKLDYFRFQNYCNPFGILFHPLAIAKLFEYALRNKQFTESDIFFHNEQWHSFDAHSDLNETDKNQLLDNLNSATVQTKKQLSGATHVIITLGTAWVYRKLENDQIVANCHKVPQKQFKKELLSVEAIRENLEKIMDIVLQFNPEAKLIFTVSPVRHIKDGFVENQWSKANLITAIHQVISESAVASYFPSYEIMMDELRDYRFYTEDMIHPNPVAIDYIWERFTTAWITEEAQQVMKEVESIQKGLAHRSFNPDSEQHLRFLENLKGKITKLAEQYPNIEF